MLQTVFTQNRSEELGNDVWRNFVVPPFFDRLDLQQARKPRVIIGGRGAGKTMLVRYLSYHSAFSPHRPSVPKEALQHIGVLWRADTQFARVMTGRGLEQHVWSAAFNHLMALVVGAEVLDSLRAINRSGVLGDSFSAEVLGFGALGAYDPAFSTDLDRLRETIEARLREFESWVANVGKIPEPVFLPGKRFISALIQDCKRQVPDLSSAVFFVYIDEYENLLEYQQEIINTFMKHSEMPLIFNVAVKRHGFTTSKTVGDESIMDVADFRTHDIERYLEEGDFSLFAAEVLLLTLHLAGWTVPIDVEWLRNPEKLKDRDDQQYRERVLAYVRTLFPSVSQKELAATVLADPTLKGKLEKTIRQALKTKGVDTSPDRFIRPQLPEATVVTTALLYRNLPVQEIEAELDALENDQNNRFTGSADWVHNNLVGCLLSLYESTSRVCPFYAGFDAFVSMARGNLRHFLELCHQSLADVTVNDLVDGGVPPDKQAQAARHTSAAFLNQIRRSGRYGNRLHSFVLGLGSLFALAHQRQTQSEPEQTHFSIMGGSHSLTDEDLEFLREAVKWSILFEEQETKIKQPVAVISKSEYVLNPIYAPFFNISYRKRRRLQLSVGDFHTLKQGSYEEVRELLNRYSRKWSVDPAEANPTLFSHLA
jgi:hypothetical protein